MKEENKKTIIVFLTLIIVVILDQITKVWAVNSLKETVPLIGNILKFQLTVNTGAGFGFLQGYNLLFIWIMIVIIGGILFYYDKIPEKSYLWFATGLIL
ncbi:MAG: signal peptidase II, partial [Candidatus Woesearchaeota archaeon]|nr:signal peptidase II [Candidatus Woesearchaeota archaeon]